jgi:hypothetical protein
MYSQSATNTSFVNASENSGFKIVDDKLQIVWDTDQHMTSVIEMVNHFMKGCSCKTSCNTNRCGCKKNGKECGPGCGCVNCRNVNGISIDNEIEDVLEDELEDEWLNMSDNDVIIEEEFEIEEEYGTNDHGDTDTVSDIGEEFNNDDF